MADRTDQRLVIGVHMDVSSVEQMFMRFDGQVNGKQFFVKHGVVELCAGEFVRMEG